METKLDNALAKMDLKITKDEDRVFYWREALLLRLEV